MNGRGSLQTGVMRPPILIGTAASNVLLDVLTEDRRWFRVVVPGAGRKALAWEAVFLAGKCFVTYRRRGGTRRSPLPKLLKHRA